jgi:hypothetical protein
MLRPLGPSIAQAIVKPGEIERDENISQVEHESVDSVCHGVMAAEALVQMQREMQQNVQTFRRWSQSRMLSRFGEWRFWNSRSRNRRTRVT